MKIIGSHFSKAGARMAFHKDDHAISAVENDGISLNPGTDNSINLQKFEVHIEEQFYLFCLQPWGIYIFIIHRSTNPN